MSSNSRSSTLKVAVVHPDLGVGGAERLIVDLSKALEYSKDGQVQYHVDIYTGYHDPNRCFDETKDGTLRVFAIGQWIPRNLLGHFHALMAYLKMLYIACYLLLFINFDILICDQVPICIPVLRLKPKSRTGNSRKNRLHIFYCHFPDQLLVTRINKIRIAYRKLIDNVERLSIKSADIVLVNSKFTRKVFNKTFGIFKSEDELPQVLYPCVDVVKFSDFEPSKEMNSTYNEKYPLNSFVFLSLNRFERKKDLALAIKAFREFYGRYVTFSSSDKKDVSLKDPHLVVAGGYDSRLPECVEYYKELESLVKASNLESQVTFVKTPSHEDKLMLLSSCGAVIYTPENEHFGIVPLEAMAMKKPVIASNSGGPMETIVSKGKDQTGYLCRPGDEVSFSNAMLELIIDTETCLTLGSNGYKRVMKHFSFQAFQKHLERICNVD